MDSWHDRAFKTASISQLWHRESFWLGRTPHHSSSSKGLRVTRDHDHDPTTLRSSRIHLLQSKWQKGIFITIKTGSGQRNPVSVILLFLVATEPLNSLLATAFMELLYTTEEWVFVGPLLFGSYNLTPLALTDDSQQPILSLYNEYTGVSGLNINITKTTALGINTPVPLCEQLRLFGMATPDNTKHLAFF